ALVISASMIGARSRPDLPEVFSAAIRISSSLTGSIFFIAGLFIHSFIFLISLRGIVIVVRGSPCGLVKEIAVHVEHFLLFRSEHSGKEIHRIDGEQMIAVFIIPGSLI